MDKESLDLLTKVWKHSGIKGTVWTPYIVNIGHKTKQRFHEGRPLNSDGSSVPEMKKDHDWYWTPAVSKGGNRKAGDYPAQRAIWVDCDESYNNDMLMKLLPTYVWETSPGHKQAIWLMKDKIQASEFNKNGLIGLITQAIGSDKSGVDIGQLLRVPGTWHNKGEPFKGKILKHNKVVQTRGQLLTRVAKSLGFPASLASEIGADDPYGDRSKQMWKFSRTACELGLPEELTFKLINACKWNKWKDSPEDLREDIGKAYAAVSTKETKAPPVATGVTSDEDEHEYASQEPWEMETIGDFGPVIHKPLKWVVPGIIPEAGCGLLVSAPKVGKTRIAIELALGISTGNKPLGISTRYPKGVGFFSLEDGNYLFSTRMNESLNRDKGRFKHHWDGHIQSKEGSITWNPPEPTKLLTSFQPIDLSENVDKQRLLETIVAYDLKVVIIDTLSMAIGKSDVSNSKDMYSILKDIKIIAKETGCAIMFIHHTRKRVFEKGESIQEMVLGSTALHAWSDFIMNLASPEEDSDMLRLAVQTKMGNDQHFVTQELKIVKRPISEE